MLQFLVLNLKISTGELPMLYIIRCSFSEPLFCGFACSVSNAKNLLRWLSPGATEQAVNGFNILNEETSKGLFQL